MRRFVLQSLILILVASGIACACPADSMAAEPSPHDMHQAHGEIASGEVESAKDESKDCCEDCDDAVAMHSESLPVAFDTRFFADDFENAPAWLPVVIDTDWSSVDAVDDSPSDSTNFLPYRSPVILRDRMLD